MSQLLAHLNAAQREAVTHIDGPLLILAGPGSGKTRVVTHRVAYLLEQGVRPGQVLALTFTNKAASEMRSRLAQLGAGGVWMSTFHRFGARLLRDYGRYVGLTHNFTIYDTGDARQTLKRVIEAEKIDIGSHSPDRIAAAISSAKNKLLTPDRYQPRPGNLLSKLVANVYPAYQRRLLDSSAVDFDDLLMLVAQLLYDHAEIRAELDERFKYILVDEYQDTNRAQYVILRALSLDHPNLAATGDPDQSIYGWRGADITNILEFERDYPEVHVVRLEQNYRSTQRVLRVADQLIAHNTRRKAKSLFTLNDEGPPVRLVSYADQDAEAEDIARQIRTAIAAGTHGPGDFAVFYRINALSRSLERALRMAQVPFQMVRGLEFYQRREIKDVLAYCQLACNPRDDVAFERTVNMPARGIGRKSLERLMQYAYHHGLSLLDASRDAVQIEGLGKRPTNQLLQYGRVIDAVAAATAGSVEEAIGTVLTVSGYKESLAGSEDEEDLNRLANIEELLTDARQFDEQYEGDQPLDDYLERTWLVNDTDNWDSESDVVTLMTLHAAKGLEFRSVFLVAMEEGILPHERSGTNVDQLEEERRLLFVGLTRAEQELQLSYTQRRDFRGQRRISVPSSFLVEMPRGEMDQQLVAAPFLEDSWDGIDESHVAAEELHFVADEWEERPRTKPARPAKVAPAISLQTAAQLAGEEVTSPTPAATRFSPDAFRHGMAVVHPEFGPGKIVALSGNGKSRKATVSFAMAGQRKFVLAHSPLRPLER